MLIYTIMVLNTPQYGSAAFNRSLLIYQLNSQKLTTDLKYVSFHEVSFKCLENFPEII